MALTVKPGREYVLGGKVYRGGESVEGVPQKFVGILTSEKGPLQHGEGVSAVRADLPAAAYATRALEPEAVPAPLDQAPRVKRQYRRRDMRADD